MTEVIPRQTSSRPAETLIDIETSGAHQSYGSGSNTGPPAERAHVDDKEATFDFYKFFFVGHACQNNTSLPPDTIKTYSATNSGTSLKISTNDEVYFDLNEGCYSVVLCLELDNDPRNLEKFESILVEWRDEDPTTASQDVETVITRDNMLSTGFLDSGVFRCRCRLPSPLTVSPTRRRKRLILSMKEYTNVQLCAVELQDVPAKPHTSISVRHPIERSGKLISIRDYAVSACGRHIATLSYTNDIVCVDLWCINAPAKQGGTWNSQMLASTSWEHLDAVYSVSVSTRGPQVAVSRTNPVKPDDKLNDKSGDMYFHLLTANSSSTTGPGKLEPSKSPICEELLKFPVIGKFFHSNGKELFIACDGLSASIYSTEGAWRKIRMFELSSSWEPSTHLFSTQRSPQPTNVPFLSSSGNCFLWNDFGRVYVWQLETGSIISMLSWGSAMRDCKFLAFDDHAIVLEIDGHMALFAAATGELLNICPVPGQPTTDGPSTPMRWIYPTDVESLTRLFDVGFSPDALARSGCQVHEYGIPSSNYSHHAEYEGFSVIYRCHGATLDVYSQEDVGLQSDGSKLKRICTGNRSEDQPVTNTQEKFGLTIEIDEKNETVVITTPIRRELLRLPIRNVWLLPKSWQLVTYTYTSKDVCIWSLPWRHEDSCVLLHLAPSIDIKNDPVPANGILTGDHKKILNLERALKLEGALQSIGVTNLYSASNLDGFADSIKELLRILLEEKRDETYRSPAIEYLKTHVNSRFDKDVDSVMSIICRKIVDAKVNEIEENQTFLIAFLANSSWIPRTSYTFTRNPLCILLRGAQTKPSLMKSANLMIDWCLYQERKTGRHEYVYFVLQCMPDLIRYHAEAALKVTQHFAYLPVPDRSFVMDNHIVVNQLWGPQAPPIYKCQNPIMQFCHNVSHPDYMNAYFTEDIFVAPFNLLWSVDESSEGHCTAYIQPDTKVPTASIWSILRYLALHQIYPRSHVYVYPHYYTLDMLSSPAIEPLIEFKWNKFAYRLWLARFLVQLCYYLLIVIAAATQIYSSNPDSLFYVFVAIVALSLLFLALELFDFYDLRRASKSDTYENVDPKRYSYFRSIYNYVDLLAFLVPLAASINQLINISQKDSGGTTWDLSVSIIIIFLHMLSELRVFQAVCKYVTIVIRIVIQIKVFFIIFALGILSFSLAIQHVIRGCPSKGGIDSVECPKLDPTDFPHSFWEAITSTYFIMGGRYDPVSKELSGSPNMALQVILVIYFFFTVILMLNVLIALINGGFNQGDGTWRLVWLENRLRYVESAEEMTYHIPGFRQKKDWFPRAIYYTATKKQVVEYENKVLNSNADFNEIVGKHRLEFGKQMDKQMGELMATGIRRASGEESDDVERCNSAVMEYVPGPADPSPSGNSQDSPQQSEEREQGQTELHQLRAQVSNLIMQQADLVKQQTDLIKQQEVAHRHHFELKNMLTRLMEQLKKD